MNYDYDDEDLMTPGQVARAFNVDPKSVSRWNNEGKLSAVRTVGGHRRFRRSDVETLLDFKRQPKISDVDALTWVFNLGTTEFAAIISEMSDEKIASLCNSVAMMSEQLLGLRNYRRNYRWMDEAGVVR
jgi:excisionase family DNA binding protein